MSLDLFAIMKEWGRGNPKLVMCEWDGPGAYVMEAVCFVCHGTLGVVHNDRYVAYKCLPPDAVPNLEIAEFIPADPKFFDKIIKSTMYHPCRKS